MMALPPYITKEKAAHIVRMLREEVSTAAHSAKSMAFGAIDPAGFAQRANKAPAHQNTLTPPGGSKAKAGMSN